MGNMYPENNGLIRNKRIGMIVFFIVPFLFTVFNLQPYVVLFVSKSIGQVLSYLMVILVLVGILFCFKDKNRDPINPIFKAWITFYLTYYVIATISSGYLGTDYSFLRTLVPVAYFFGFLFYLSIKENRELFLKIAVWALFLVNLLSIYFDFINFSLDFDGVAEYRIERSAGIYGDSNNSALISILGFIFIFYVYEIKKKSDRWVKSIALMICVYALVITYSTTGFLAFFIVCGIIFSRHLSVFRLIVILPIILFVAILGYGDLMSSNLLSDQQKGKVENIVNLITLNTDGVNFSGRDDRLGNLFIAVEKNPFLGNGLDYGGAVLHSHNTYFNIWADAGAFVFVIFIYIVFLYIFKTITSKSWNKLFFLSIMISLSIFMMTLQTIINQAYLIVFFVLIGYMIYEDIYKQKRIL